jgi:hypothetical protein
MVLVATTVIAGLLRGDIHALFMMVFWQAILAFLLLALSMVILSPVLFWAIERRRFSQKWRATLIGVAIALGVAFIVCVVAGALELSMAVGMLLNGVTYLVVAARPNTTVERDGPEATRPSL